MLFYICKTILYGHTTQQIFHLSLSICIMFALYMSLEVIFNSNLINNHFSSTNNLSQEMILFVQCVYNSDGSLVRKYFPLSHYYYNIVSRFVQMFLKPHRLFIIFTRCNIFSLHGEITMYYCSIIIQIVGLYLQVKYDLDVDLQESLSVLTVRIYIMYFKIW